MKKAFFLLIPFLIFLSGCSKKISFFLLDEQYLSRRQTETRFYETTDEEMLSSACAQVLQDQGFTITESETTLGLITGFKIRKADSNPSYAFANSLVFLSMLAGNQEKFIYDTEQKIYVTIVSTYIPSQKGYNVRISLTRTVWNNYNQVRNELIVNPEIYQQLFNDLSQSMFLTANNI